MSSDALTLTPELAERLRRKAAELRQQPEELLASLVERYLSDEDAYLAAVREGLQDLDEGRVVDFEDVKRDARARLAKLPR